MIKKSLACPLIVAIFGGIASGKTTILRQFAQLGVATFPLDNIVHWAYLQQHVALSLTNLVGYDGWRQGTLNRISLRKRLLSDPQLQKIWSAILYPAVRSLVMRAIYSQSHPTSYVILEIPLLSSSIFWQKCVHHTLLIISSPQVQKERLMSRPGMTEQMADLFLKYQPSILDNLRLSHEALINDENPEFLKKKVRSLHISYQERARYLKSQLPYEQ